MPLSSKDRDQVVAMIRQEMGSRTNMVNQIKGAGMDRREDKLTDLVAYTAKGDDESPPANSTNPTAT